MTSKTDWSSRFSSSFRLILCEVLSVAGIVDYWDMYSPINLKHELLHWKNFQESRLKVWSRLISGEDFSVTGGVDYWDMCSPTKSEAWDFSSKEFSRKSVRIVIKWSHTNSIHGIFDGSVYMSIMTWLIMTRDGHLNGHVRMHHETD